MKALLLSALLLGGTPVLPAPTPPEPPLTPIPIEAPSLPEDIQSALDGHVRAELARRPHAGLSVGVMHGAQRWVRGYGMRDVARRKPATPRTTYRMASITKSFTAVAVLQLVQQGRLSLDTDVHTLVPAFPAQPWPVTVRQLLGHLGGVPHYDGPEAAENIRRLDTAGALALFAHKPLVAEPGTQFVYSTWGYNLLGAAVESASGQGFGDYLRTHVFGPTGMSTAALDDYRTRDTHQAVGYRLSHQGRLVPSHYLDVSSRFAGGGVRASVEDLLAFGQAMLHDRLVTRDTARMMQTPMRTRDGLLTDYGMGFATYPLRGHYVVAHAGGQPETTTLLLLLPAEDIVLALATNLEGDAKRLRRLSNRIIETLREDGHVRRDAAFSDPMDATVHEGIARLFTYGLAYHAAPGDVPKPGDLIHAFTQVTELLDRARIAPELPATLERIRTAHQPREGALFIRVGMEMARTLERVHGRDKLGEYPRRGPLAFFTDYLAACEQEECPAPLRFNQALRQDALRFNENWRRAQVPGLVRTRLNEATRPESLWPAMEAASTGVFPHPDYVEEMLRVASSQASLGRFEEQRRWLERAVALHPRSEEARIALARARAPSGQVPGGSASPLPRAESPVPDNAGLLRRQRPAAEFP
ncbi:serine hydrolase domain-containing protein [Melittangium boletus]|uniref:Beta-lactamase-related domain-containing protein n=1 Tax=Melittangium boletus DSM 14713 TaxID=1294270 RepID=A0A250IGE7_9BACT|nr:serine hydrolase domain-containing protein [Melittangium boletus]ATB30227.1 hypothetical protein MEBOL_003687 [Melittangium boletus DSM 14713]